MKLRSLGFHGSCFYPLNHPTSLKINLLKGQVQLSETVLPQHALGQYLVTCLHRAYEDSLTLGCPFPAQPYGLRPSLSPFLYLVPGMFGDGFNSSPTCQLLPSSPTNKSRSCIRSPPPGCGSHPHPAAILAHAQSI